jgi:tryptophan 7-halogenase
MSDNRLASIVIVGGGTAGWMAAAALINKFGGNRHTKITVVESDAIGTVGVGEATVPQIRDFLKQLKINEIDFVRRTNATFKLAIGFDGWAGDGTLFFHPFAEHGVPIMGTPFQHHWAKLRTTGEAEELDRYCVGSELARAGKFALPKPNDGGKSFLFNYALHFDASLAAAYLRSWAMTVGVKRVEGRITRAVQNGESGDVEALELEGERRVEGDFFIDCSGFRGLLIEETLQTGYDSWRHWLACDRALAAPCESKLAPMAYTRSLACDAGWQWRIPLQHRVGNGYVYCSDFISDERAADELIANLEGPALADPRLLTFETGMRRKMWNKNVYCLGLASGFLEPLESTSIYLVQWGLSALIANFPTRASNRALAEEVNRLSRQHWEHVRDFIILHYYLNKREGRPFWDECRAMSVPDSLSEVVGLFRETGRVRQEHRDFFRWPSWLALFAGFGVLPKYYHPAVDDLDEDVLASELANLAAGVREAVAGAPDHGAFIAKNCAAPISAKAAGAS